MGEVSRLRWVPPALAVALGLLALGAVLVDLVGPMVLHQAGPGGSVATWLITLTVTLPCTAVGVLLAARRPANPIGWLLLTLLLLTAEPTDVFAILDYRLHHGTLPLGWVAVLFLGGPLVNVLMAILLWLFPDGHLPAGRWHGLSTAAVAAGLLAGIATTVGPGLAAVAGHDVHIDAGGNLYPVSPAWIIAGNVTSTAALVSMLGWLALQVPRYRRAGAERYQRRAIEHGAPRLPAGPRLDLVCRREQPLLDGPVRDEAPGAVEHRLPGRPRLPAEDAPGLVGGVPVAAAERRGDLPQRPVREAGREPHQRIRHRPGRHPAAVGAQAAPQDPGHLRHPHELPGGEEALPGGVRRRHRADVDVGQVADVDDLQADAWDDAH
jgi:hypothetical protein